MALDHQTIDQIFAWVRPWGYNNLAELIGAAKQDVLNRSGQVEHNIKNYLDQKLANLSANIVTLLIPKIEQSCRKILEDAPVLQGIDIEELADKIWERIQPNLP